MNREQLQARMWPWLQRSAAVSAWAALALVVAAWVLLQLTDRHWLGTLVAYGPRWMLMLVVVGAATLAAFWRPKSLWLVACAAAVVLGPAMGLCVPWRTMSSRTAALQTRRAPTDDATFKVITCNTLQGKADARLLALIDAEEPDVVVLQEWPGDRPIPGLEENWQIAQSSGLVVASRWPIVSSEPLTLPGSSWRTLALRCELATSAGTVQFYGMHLTTPRDGIEAVRSGGFSGLAELEEVTLRRRQEAALVADWMNEHAGPTLVAGDLNLTPESTIYRRTFGHLQNGFSTAGWGWGGTKFTRVHGVRIDHILADDNWQVRRCSVGPNVGSDHRPVIAELAAR